MDWKAKVDLFEQLRREHEFGIGTVAGVAAKFGVHRRMVRQALASALPPARHYPQRARPKLDTVASFIDQVLEEDPPSPFIDRTAGFGPKQTFRGPGARR